MFILVRHAHAGNNRHRKGHDRDRPLSARGRQQAAGLDRNLSAIEGVRFLSSPALRCHQTLAPLAGRFNRLIETSALLGPKADPAKLEAFLDTEDREGAVLCTHGETLAGLVKRWRRHGVVVFVDPPAIGGSSAGRDLTEKGAAWIVVDDGSGRSLHYLPPLHLGPVLAPGGPAPAKAGSGWRRSVRPIATSLQLHSAPDAF